ncbi:hypothetical protein DKM44_08430 [Deinococcus irradiatisoli]|uniref:DUF2946 domain-containing protein n=1 Tax=Deinococcus irradiatisoli TaxID=2202254 RepID=A0A2Z3JNZ1_9DEIO|nr:hypothetical protein [Deinococcus irradiatisoli]AWN23248.1 hypothetical protein DKM44_08430 [Deinococcus irradiatisoli]
MPRPAVLRVQRVLAALLWLLASLAYLTREQDMHGMAALAPDMPMVAASTPHPATRKMPAMPFSPEAGAARPRSGLQPDDPPAPPQHDHAGHCPFCFASAFALEAFTANLTALPLAERRFTNTLRPRAGHLPTARPSARAPPFWS